MKIEKKKPNWRINKLSNIITLPCDIGDIFYWVDSSWDKDWCKEKISVGRISMLIKKSDGSWNFRLQRCVKNNWYLYHTISPDEIGVKYFSTKEQAEEELNKLQCKTNICDKCALRDAKPCYECNTCNNGSRFVKNNTASTEQTHSM